jgi:hypothetical protein
VLPPLEKESRPKPVPTATPTPAPPPSEVEPAFSLPKLPGIPAVPETKKAGSNDSLPPLVLPPESAGGPSGVVPESTSRSSPLSAGVRVQVFIATGSLTAATTRRIGFFNHTNRDLDLVIEGRPVTLPRKSYIHAEVPATFSWRHSDNPAQPTTVPAGSPGLDVLFRE